MQIAEEAQARQDARPSMPGPVDDDVWLQTLDHVAPADHEDESDEERDRSLEPGARVADRFVLSNLLTVGGMATLYGALDERDGSNVVLKVLSNPSAEDALRFSQEADVLAALRHPDIVRYVAHGPLEPRGMYIAMEWVQGEDLSKRLRRGRFSTDEAISLVERVAETLAVAHEAGIVHRDVKPSNVLLSGGSLERPKLCDFGVARVAGSSLAPASHRSTGSARAAASRVQREDITRHDSLLGTLGYMAPEQARCERDVGARADVFSLGCVLYACLTGRPPFAGRDLVALLAQIALDDAPRLRDLLPDAPPPLDALVAEMLSNDPGGRPRDAGAVAARLRLLRTLSVERPAMEPRAVERMLVSVVLARAPMGEALEQIAAAHGARAVSLVEGTAAFVLSSQGAATELAVRGARCARAVAETDARLSVSMATGWTEGGRAPVGPVIARASELGRGRGGVWVDEMSAGLLRGRFDLEPSGDRKVFALQGKRPGRARAERIGACVGREQEVAAVLAAVDASLADGRARLVRVLGAAGAGKSRVLDEVLRGLHARSLGDRVFFAEGDPLTEGVSLSLLASGLARWAELLEGDPQSAKTSALRRCLARSMEGAALEHATEFLGALVGAGPRAESFEFTAARGDPKLMREQLQRAFDALIAAVTAGGAPLIVIIEDAHWADSQSLRCLQQALDAARDRPLVVLAIGASDAQTLLDAPLKGDCASTISLAPLGEVACAAVVRRLLPDISPDPLRSLIDRSGGNPFFLEELARAESAGAAAHGAPAVPATILATIQARIESLAAGERTVLRACSVFGHRFHTAGISALVADQALDAWLERLVEGEWLVPDELAVPGERALRFAHELHRDAAYEMLPADVRVEAHRVAGAWLEARGGADAVTLARHFEAAGERHRAARSYERAGRQALDGLDPARALALASRGLALTEDPELRGELALVSALALRDRSESSRAIEQGVLAQSLLRRGTTPWIEATGVVALAAGRLGDHARVRRAAEDLAATEPAVDAPSGLIATWVQWAGRNSVSLLQSGQRPLARAILDRAEARVEQVPEHVGAAGAVAHGRFSRAMREGDLPRAITAARECLALAVRAGHRHEAHSKTINLAYALAESGQYDEAASSLRAIVVRDGTLDETRALALQNLGNILGRTRSIDEALLALDESIALSARVEQPRLAAYAHGYAAVGLALAGRWSESESRARAGLAMSERFASARSFLLAALARTLVAQGRFAEALDAAERCELLRAELGGLEGEALIGLALYEARASMSDRRGAELALEAALARLDARAEKITDVAARGRYLSTVAEHATLVSLRNQPERFGDGPQ